MQLMLVIRLPDGRSYQRAVNEEGREAVPRRGEPFLVKDLGAELPVHGVSELGSSRPALTFIRQLEIPDVHRLQCLGWKLQKN